MKISYEFLILFRNSYIFLGQNRWSKSFYYMQNQKTNTPNSILDVKQYIFCDSDDGFVLSDPRFMKIFKSCQNALKSFDLSFKKDVPFFF